MTFVMDALKDRPLALFQMDDTSPVQDHSGYDVVGTITGTPPQHAALVKGAAWAPVFSSSITCAFDSQVFKQGEEDQPFTLGAWVKIVNPSGNSEQKILSNPGQYDGLLLNGNVVSFVTKYTTAAEARCSFDLQQEKAFSVFGVHTKDKNSLYVNGVLVSEVTLTEAQQADTFASTSTTLVTGATTGNQKVAVNGIAMYNTALSGVSITRQHAVGRDVQPAEDIVSSRLGNYIAPSLSNANVFLDQWWTSLADWQSAQLNNVSIVNDQLVPQFEGTTSVAGNWMDSFALASANIIAIYGVQFNWDGEGITIQCSLDGTSWETVTRGVNVSTIPPGFDPTDKELQIRVSFAGGIVDDTSYLDNLNVVGLKSSTSNEVMGRTLAFASAYPERDYPVLEYHDNWGVEIASGGSVTISADAAESTAARTIELWIKRKGANPTLSMTGTTYQNGAVSTATLVDDQWTLMHVVAAADVTGTIVINGPAQVGLIGIYETALNATQIADIYAAYVGANALKVGDNSVLTITEPSNAATIYAHDWVIQGAG